MKVPGYIFASLQRFFVQNPSYNFLKMLKKPANKKFLRWSLITGVILLLGGAGLYFYYATLRYEDTTNVKPDFNVEALPFIKSFIENNSLANKKYTEKIISVSGRISAIEPADTTLNIKFIDPATGSYAIFAFQKQHLDQVKTLRNNDSVTIKGSCSGGAYSEILSTVFITFKRCVLEKKH